MVEVVHRSKVVAKDIMRKTKIKTIILNQSLTIKRSLTIIKMIKIKRRMTMNSKTMKIKMVMMIMVATIGTSSLSIIVPKTIRITKKNSSLKPLHLWVKDLIAFMRSVTVSLKLV